MVLLGSINVSPSAASVKAGTACATANQIKNISGFSYTCVKVGKKLMWSKGTQITESKPTTSAHTTDVPAATKVAAFPTDFSNLYENRANIALAAWQKTHDTLLGNGQSSPTISVFRGPTTPTYVTDIDKAFALDLKLFPNATVPKKVVVIYWNHADLQWAKTLSLVMLGASDMQNYVQYASGPFVDCYTPTSCNVGHAFIASDGTAYIGIGLPDKLTDFPGSGMEKTLPLGQIETVEFYHALQLMYYYVNKSVITTNQNIISGNFPPSWLNIGSENYTTSVLQFANDSQGYVRSMAIKGWINSVVPNFSLDWLTNYLSLENLGNKWSDSGVASGGINVCMGQALMEIFIALKGPGVTLDFHDQMSRGLSFQDAFRQIFGTTWQSASPEIAKVIWDKYQFDY
jgi:hypothetical protein